MTGIRPLAKVVVVRPDSDDSQEEEVSRGEVVAVNEVSGEVVRVGDRVAFDPYDGVPVTVNEEYFVLVGADKLLAVLDESWERSDVV